MLNLPQITPHLPKFVTVPTVYVYWNSPAGYIYILKLGSLFKTSGPATNTELTLALFTLAYIGYANRNLFASLQNHVLLYTYLKVL